MNKKSILGIFLFCLVVTLHRLRLFALVRNGRFVNESPSVQNSCNSKGNPIGYLLLFLCFSMDAVRPCSSFRPIHTVLSRSGQAA